MTSKKTFISNQNLSRMTSNSDVNLTANSRKLIPGKHLRKQLFLQQEAGSKEQQVEHDDSEVLTRVLLLKPDIILT